MPPQKNCPNFLSKGTCNDPSCRYQHNILVCEPCSFLAPNPAAYKVHLNTRRHRSRTSGVDSVLYCSVCKTNVQGTTWAQHSGGRRHQRQAKDSGVSADNEPEEGVSTLNQKYCVICKISVQIRFWSNHLRGFGHKSREKYSAYRAALDEAEKDKNGIIVEGDLDFDIIEPAQANGAIRSAVLKTTTPNLRVKLLSLKLISSRGSAVTAFTVVPEGSNRDINPRSSIKLVATLVRDHISRYEDRLELTFEDSRLRKQFLISRPVRAIVGNRADHEKLKASAPFVPRLRGERKPETKVYEGQRPPSLKAIPYLDKLPKAPTPARLLQAISEGSTVEIVTRLKGAYLPAILDSDSFARHFRTLLWIEEHKTGQDLERYDLPDTKITKHNSYFFVEVPGLAEKRPSVLLGDCIFVQPHGGPEGHWFEGFVHVVRREEVGLRFHRYFKWSPSQLYHVRFKLNRIPLRRQHHALDMVFQEDRALFPTEGHADAVPRLTSATMPRLRYHNPDIAFNTQQARAVMSILKLPPGSPTFTIFGPFGTGKTSTVIEAILQILDSNPRARILTCAPSNSAADLITTKLGSALNKDQLFRFNAPSRDKNLVPDNVLEYSHLAQLDGVDDDEFLHLPRSQRPKHVHFGVPTARIKIFRVIVSTCISASFAAGIGVPRGHFSHIFIDEAGQATEPEALVSVKTLADNSTNIILAGDPKQLGPIIRSPIARELGLQKSYLERLMERDAYDIARYSGLTVVKLINNYRCHPAILKFPNERFYRGELQVKAKREKTDKYIGCPLLPSRKFPIVFHAVFGKDEQEASSPSFFNVDEVLQLKDYVQKLRAERRYVTTDDDIGIISPYHAQCRKIRTALQGVADKIKIGSVEEFQGQERPVIMISTVRSSKERVQYDLRHTLGFVANPRRFNVAITRTQALLIIVGDPQVLSIDPLWRSFLNYVYNSGGWKGPDPDWDTTVEVNMDGGYDQVVRERAQLDMNEFTLRMEALTMEGADDDDTVIDQPWRDLE